MWCIGRVQWSVCCELHALGSASDAWSLTVAAVAAVLPCLPAWLLPLPLPQVVVIAKLLEPRPSFSNMFGLRLSPSKTSLTQQQQQQQQPPSPLAHTGSGGGGSLTPRCTLAPKWDVVQDMEQGKREDYDLVAW
jgi:hypothetical protein